MRSNVSRSASLLKAWWWRSRKDASSAYNHLRHSQTRRGRDIDGTTFRRGTDEMKQATRALFLGSLIGALPIAACDCGGAGIGKLDPVLKVEPLEIDFGEVPIGVRVQAAVTISNTGSGM